MGACIEKIGDIISAEGAGERCTYFCLCCVVTTVLIVVGIVLLQNLNEEFFTNGECVINVSIGEEIRNEDDYIGLIFTSCPSTALLEAFVTAASIWSGIISENLIRPTTLGVDNLQAKNLCNFLNGNAQLESGFVADHLVIFVDLTFFDGVGGTLGAAGPCVRDSNGFPVFSGMKFELDDLRNLAGSPALDTLILHEMAHAIGFGSDWLSRDLVEDPIFPSDSSVNADNIPKYVGSQGLFQYNDLTGEDSSFVPVEDGRRNGVFTIFKPDINPDSGRGSIDLHWHRDELVDEVMVFAIRNDGREYALSTVTLGAIADLGYSVDYSKADAYTPSTYTNLRGKTNVEDESDLLLLIDDIINVEQKSILDFT